MPRCASDDWAHNRALPCWSLILLLLDVGANSEELPKLEYAQLLRARQAGTIGVRVVLHMSCPMINVHVYASEIVFVV